MFCLNYVEKHGDLFKMDNSYYLCHCISADFRLGKGIAVEFDRRYNMRKKLMDKFTVNGVYPRAVLIDNVFNLVTKDKYWNKPTYSTLQGALEDMRNQIQVLQVKKLAMPCIGSGLDRLEWVKVRRMIKEIFNNVDIEIVVCIK